MGFGGRSCIGAFLEWPGSGPYYDTLLRGIHDACDELDMNLLVFSTSESQLDETKERRPGNLVFNYIDSEILDGLVLIEKQDYLFGKTDLEYAKPTITINQPLRDLPTIMTDSTVGFDALLDHLFAYHGYRNPVFVSGPMGKVVARDRLACFKEVSSRFGIGDMDKRVYFGNFMRQDGEGAIRYIYEELGMKPDVIVCANDSMAIGVQQALFDRGIRTPDHVALTGFDDATIFDWYEGMLTTVRQPIYAAGKLAVSTLRGMIDGLHPIRGVEYLPTELVLRRSCGCKSKAKNWLKSPELLSKSGKYWFEIAESGDVERIADFLLQNEALEHFAKLDRDQSIDSRLGDFCNEYMKDWRIAGHGELEHRIMLDLEIGTQYLSLFDGGYWGLDGQSRLNIAWVEGRREGLPEGGIPYPSRLLIPGEFLPDRRISLIVEPLVNGEDAYGVLAMQYGAKGSNIYAKIRYRLSEAIKSVRSSVHLKELNEELEAARTRFEELSLTDELTGQYNRRGFITLATQQIIYCRRRAEPFLILFIDLDGLKTINDTCGHDEGDLAIRAISSVIQKAFRSSDITARLGGDEFIVFASLASNGDSAAILSRLEGLVHETNRALAKPWRLSFSTGQFLSDPSCELSLEEMMRLADERLYLEKRNKKAGIKSDVHD